MSSNTSGRTLLLYLGVTLIAVGYDNILAWMGIPLTIAGAMLLYIRDNVSWGVNADIVKLATRVNLHSVDLIWDNDEKKLLAITLTEPKEEKSGQG